MQPRGGAVPGREAQGVPTRATTRLGLGPATPGGRRHTRRVTQREVPHAQETSRTPPAAEGGSAAAGAVAVRSSLTSHRRKAASTTGASRPGGLATGRPRSVATSLTLSGRASLRLTAEARCIVCVDDLSLSTYPLAALLGFSK